MSLLPKHVFDVIKKSQRSQLRDSDLDIKSVNNKSIKCFGMSDINLKVENQSFKHKFYICEDDVSVLLGRDFMKHARVVMEPARNKIKVNGKRVTAYDLKGTKIRNTVNLITTMTLKPGQERQVWAKLKGKGQPEDMVCVKDVVCKDRCTRGTTVYKTPAWKVCSPHTQPDRGTHHAV